jgi:ComF family protein
MTHLTAGLPCRGCGKPGSLLCGRCASLEPGAADGSCDRVDRVIARWAYEGIPRGLILDLKIRGARLCADALADGIVQAVHAQGVAGSVITWVPGRRADIRVRGFDHAALLARAVGRRVGLPCASLLLRRSDPPDQTLLSADERRQNLRGVFASKECSGTVILVDDLVTTGATATACAQALRRAGASGVELLVPCRA